MLLRAPNLKQRREAREETVWAQRQPCRPLSVASVWMWAKEACHTD